MQLRDVSSESDLLAAFSIRLEVFVLEQGVPSSLERDEIDPTAHHALAGKDGNEIGTGRWFPDPSEPGVARIGRLAVRKAFRGQGIGKQILQYLMNWCSKAGFRKVRLHAQKQAIGFYAGMGFKNIGEEFLEAGILHQEMEASLP